MTEKNMRAELPFTLIIGIHGFPLVHLAPHVLGGPLAPKGGGGGGGGVERW